MSTGWFMISPRNPPPLLNGNRQGLNPFYPFRSRRVSREELKDNRIFLSPALLHQPAPEIQDFPSLVASPFHKVNTITVGFVLGFPAVPQLCQIDGQVTDFLQFRTSIAQKNLKQKRNSELPFDRAHTM